MDRQILQTTLRAAQARLIADRAGVLTAAGMPSGLAYLTLPLLQTLAAVPDRGEVSDLLRELVGKQHRRELLGALDDLAALRALDGDSPLGQACAALLNGIARSEDRTALGAQMQMVVGDHGAIVNSRIVQVQPGAHLHEAPPDPARARQERALIDYLRAIQTECNPLQLNRIDAGESRYQQPMRLERVYISLDTESRVAREARTAGPRAPLQRA